MNKLEMTNPFYNLDSPDERKEVKQDNVLIPGLEGLLRKCEEMFSKNRSHEVEKIIQNIDDILTPEQINIFLQSTIKYEEHLRYQLFTGEFISELIQNSYDAGNNNFILNTKTLKEIHWLGMVLRGKKRKPIEITIEGNTEKECGVLAVHSNFKIEGNTGDKCGSFAEYSNFYIEGNAGDKCGRGSRHLNFTIKGNTGDECGSWSRHLNFTIKGNTGDECGENAKHSYFDIHGGFGKEIGGKEKFSSNCTFITYKENLYERLLKELPKKRKNKAILKDKNGNIIEEKTI